MLRGYLLYLNDPGVTQRPVITNEWNVKWHLMIQFEQCYYLLISNSNADKRFTYMKPSVGATTEITNLIEVFSQSV